MKLKRQSTKLFCMVMAVVMVVGGLPAITFAAGETDDDGIHFDTVAAPVAEGCDYVAGQVIVITDGSAVLQKEVASNSGYSGSESLATVGNETFLGHIFGWDDTAEIMTVTSDTMSTEELMEEIAKIPGVLSVEPDYITSVEPENSGTNDGTGGGGGNSHDTGKTPDGNDPNSGNTGRTPDGNDPNSGNTGRIPDSGTLPGGINIISDSETICSGSGTCGEADSLMDLTQYQWTYNTTYGINVPGWNDRSEGSPGRDNAKNTVVAVIDTGVDYNHEDLKDVMWDEGLNYPELSGEPFGGGRYGYNAVKDGDTSDPMDFYDHGTHCAGIIAASWNGTGVSGGADGTRIMAVKVTDDGYIRTSELVKAFNYVITAKKCGVNVVATNNSYGYDYFKRSESLMLEKAGEAGIVSVFASSNSTLDNDTSVESADGFRNNPCVLAVDSIDSTGELSYFTDYGDITTDICAPGHTIFSTVPTDSDDVFAHPLISEPLQYGGLTCLDRFNDDTRLIDFETGSVDTSAVGVPLPEGGNDAGVFRISSTDSGIIDIPITPCDELKNADFPEGKRLTFMIRIPDAGRTGNPDCTVLILAHIEGDDYLVKGVLEITDYNWNFITATMPEIFFDGSDECCFYIYDKSSDYGNNEYELDMMMLTDNGMPYSYMSGTSMACPAVTSEVAIIASHFYNGETGADDAAEIAARVIASARVPESGNAALGMCVSDGYADVGNALDESTYRPVVRSVDIEADGRTAVISGYFFSESGTVTIGGKAATAAEWSGSSITCRLPEGVSAGMNRIEVTSAGKTGHKTCNLMIRDDNLAQRLPLPEEPDLGFYDSFQDVLCGLGDRLYYVGNNPSDEGLAMMRCYDIYSQSWTDLTSTFADSGFTFVELESITVCTYDGKLVIHATYKTTDESEETLGFMIYDPKNRKWTAFAPEETKKSPLGALINTGNELLWIDMNGDDDEKPGNSIFSLDPGAGTATKIGEMQPAVTSSSDNAKRCMPVVAYAAEGEARIAFGTSKVFPAYSKYEIITRLDRLTVSGGNAADEILVNDMAVPWNKASQTQETAGAPVEGGIIFTGPALFGSGDGSNPDNVTADTYTLTDDGTVTPIPTLFSHAKLANIAACAYKGNYYVIADEVTGNGNRIFGVIPVNTIEQPGDTIAGENQGFLSKLIRAGVLLKANLLALGFVKNSILQPVAQFFRQFWLVIPASLSWRSFMRFFGR